MRDLHLKLSCDWRLIVINSSWFYTLYIMVHNALFALGGFVVFSLHLQTPLFFNSPYWFCHTYKFLLALPWGFTTVSTRHSQTATSVFAWPKSFFFYWLTDARLMATTLSVRSESKGSHLLFWIRHWYSFGWCVQGKLI